MSSSTHSRTDETPPLGASCAAIPQPPDPLPVTSPSEACVEKNSDAAESSWGIPTFKRLLQMRIKKDNRDPTLRERDQLSRSQPVDRQSRSPTRVDARPSRMAAARGKTVSAHLFECLVSNIS